MNSLIASTMMRTKRVALAAAVVCQFVLVVTSRSVGQTSNSTALESNGPGATLWYRQPAQQWLEAMPIGNGMIGAMVFGGVPQERIALNESSFWSGRPHDYNDTNAVQYFPQIRDLVFADKFQEAEKMVNDHFYGKPKAQEAYQPIGDLLLSFGSTNFTDYRRELDLATGLAALSGSHEGAAFRREVFCSAPDQVLVVRSGDLKRECSALDRPRHEAVHVVALQ